MGYTKQSWQDEPTETTPLSADRMGHLEDGVKNASDRLDAVEADGDGVTSVNGFTGPAVALSASDVGADPAGAVTTHAGASNPHSQYATTSAVSTVLGLKADQTDVLSLNNRTNALEAAPPAHQHPVSDMTATGTRSDTTFLRGDNTWAAPPSSGGGVTDHGALTGLGDDDHTQYHNDTRGDARYYLKADVDTAVAGRVPSARTVSAGTGLTGGGDLSANRSLAVGYGTVAGSSAQGNDSRIVGAAQKSANLSDVASPAAARANLGAIAKLAEATDVDVTGAAVGKVVAVTGTGPTVFGLTTPAAGDLPEYSNAPQAAAVTAAGMLSKLTRYNTIGGAITQALPPATAGAQLGFAWDLGTPALTISGATRTDTAGTTSGSSTVTDTSIVAADLGRAVTGTGIPAGSYVGTVTAGASFLLSSSPTSQVAVTATATGSGVSLTVQDTFGATPVTSFVVPLSGEVLTYHCTTAGRWRATSGLKPQNSLDARYPVTDMTSAAVGNLVSVAHVSGSGNADAFRLLSTAEITPGNIGAQPAGNYATLVSGTIPDAQIPAGIARDSEVSAAVAALVNSAPGTLDTLGEIATALAADESTAAALATTVAGKLAKASNLSDLVDPTAARTNLGVAAQSLIVPPAATLLTVSATAWPAANRALFMRFGVTVPTPVRYINWRCDTSSGNVQVGIVALSGTDYLTYTRTAHTGSIACPTAGNIRSDLGAGITLPAGSYAAFIWADNVTFQARTATNSGIAPLRIAAEVSSLSTGVGASGTIPSWAFQIVNLTIEPA